MKHLQRYLDEFGGRHNIRMAETMDQMELIAWGMVGKRLRCKDLIADNDLPSGARSVTGTLRRQSESLSPYLFPAINRRRFAAVWPNPRHRVIDFSVSLLLRRSFTSSVTRDRASPTL